MPFVTRCPACRTRFRVTAEQLQVSDGWVRCGQCDESFDARLDLRDAAASAGSSGMPPGSPPPPNVGTTPGFPESAPRALPGAADGGAARLAGEAPFGLTGLLRNRSGRPLEPAGIGPMRYTPSDIDAAPHPSALRPPAVAAPPPRSAPVDAAPAQDAVPPAPAEPAQGRPSGAPFRNDGTRPVPDWNPPDGDIPSALLLHTADSDVPQDQLYDPAFAALALPPAGSADAAIEEDPELRRLSFVREARRRAFWGRPGVRAATAAAGLLSAVALALQVAHHERDRIAARFPAARPAIASMCGALGCAVAPLRQIESIALDSARFGKVGPGRYRLALGMRNGAAVAVATPSAELTLSDAQGRTVFRRVLQPQELGAPETLAAGGEWNGALALSSVDEAQTAAVSDYGLLLFYP